MTPAAYLAQLPPERKKALSKLRKLIRQHLPSGFKEGMGHGMITYSVPLKVLPDTYNGEPLMYAALASQSAHMALYLMSGYVSPSTQKILQTGFKKAGKKLNMGKSCLRFKSLEELDLPTVAKAIGSQSMTQYIEAHEKGQRVKKR